MYAKLSVRCARVNIYTFVVNKRKTCGIFARVPYELLGK